VAIREETSGGQFLSLLAGQKNVFEQIARGAPLTTVLEGLVYLIQAHSSAGSKASILLVDEDGSRLVHGAAPSLPDEYNAAIHGIEIGPVVGSCGTAAYRGQTVIAADIAGDPLWMDFRDLALRHGLRACWSSPITAADGLVLGTFAIYRDEPGDPSESDLAVLSTFAQTAAVAIERDRDLAAILREKASAEALQRVGTAIARRLDLEEIVQVATDAATELTRAQFGAFFYNVLDAKGESYVLYTLSGVPRAAFERFPMPRNTAIFAPTFEGLGTVRFPDVTAQPEFGQNPPFHGMPEGHLPVRSYLAVPVVTSDGKVAGGLFFGHEDIGVFGSEAERLVEGIAAQAAIGIENARLYEAAQREIEARHRAFEERDRVARTLQANLLPPSIPAVPGLDVDAGYRGAGEGIDLVGDFYDVFERAPGRWSLIIGDVCGKGVEAATVTALARHTVRAAAMTEDSPSAVLRTLNDAIRLQDDGSGRFLTAIYAEIELEEGDDPVVTLCVAGHPPALIRGADGTIRSSANNGQLLGTFEEVTLTDERHVLEPGAVLLLVTDGVLEARRAREQFGEPRLRDALAGCGDLDAARVVDTVANAVAAHADAITDDVAIVVVRVP
jgi:GAF domain-containing protein